MRSGADKTVTTPSMLGLDIDKQGVVHYRAAPLALPRKEKGVLLLLLREWPSVVDKSCFARELWDGDMSDDSLARCVTKLRAALKGIAGISIRSVYGKGYQLQADSPAPPAAHATAPPVAYSRLLDAARIAPALAETLMHSRMLIQQRTNSSLERAEALLRTMMAQAPDYVPAKIAFAECLAGQVSSAWGLRPEHIEEGLRLLAGVARQSPDAAGLLSQKAHLLDCTWRFDEAQVLHALALQTKADDPATHYHRGWHLQACGDGEQALEAYHDAYALAPFSPTLAIMMTRAYSRAGKPEQALAYARKAHEDHPESSQAYVFWLVNEAIVQPRAALIDRFLEIRLDDLSWSFAPSSVSYGLALCGASEAAAELVARSADDNPSLRSTYISTQLLLGDTEGAQARIEAAAELGCGFLPISLLSPANRRLREHPRYAGVHAAVFRNLPPLAPRNG